MADDASFNTYAAGEFITEYQHETGELLRFKRVGDRFPDVILESPDGREVGVEFVSIVLSFINQEHCYFDQYRNAILTALQQQRPRYQHVTITLQPHHQHVERARPIPLPDINHPEGRQLVGDFVQLLDLQFEYLGAIWGGKDGGALLNQLRTTDGRLCYPILSKYFGAIRFHQMTPQEVSGSAALSDDPVIMSPVVWYSNIEIVTAVSRALATKAAKGRAYSSDLLVLHTLPKPCVADVSGIAMNAGELAGLGQALLASTQELTARFREI